jgi:hypothetical protein
MIRTVESGDDACELRLPADEPGRGGRRLLNHPAGCRPTHPPPLLQNTDLGVTQPLPWVEPELIPQVGSEALERRERL